jgi:NADPH-dependent curcumin reductase CurA
VYGINRLTAYYGIVEVGKPRPGETVLVSSAAGSVGSIAGQIAKILGARVIGLTSTQEKQDVLTGWLGFDAALDYRADDLAARLRELIPGGADVYFDNVGGNLSQIVMNQMRRPARIVECGQISTYERDAWQVDISPIHLYGLRFEGFNPLLFADGDIQALTQLVEWVQTGKLIPLETEHTGLTELPVALEVRPGPQALACSLFPPTSCVKLAAIASLRSGARKDGSTHVQELYRLGGKQTSTSFEDMASAAKFQKLARKFGRSGEGARGHSD